MGDRTPRSSSVLLSLANRCHFDDPRARGCSLNVSAEHGLLNEKATHQIGMETTMVEMTAPAYRDETGKSAPRRDPSILPETLPKDTSTPDHAVAVSSTASTKSHEAGMSFCTLPQTLR